MHVKGFVDNMDEWMSAVDCIVTKVREYRGLKPESCVVMLD